MKNLIPVILVLVIGASAWGADTDLLTPEPHRITDEAISGDIKVIQGLQKRLADLNNKAIPIASYHFAKAQAWLDFAMDEYTINDRSRVVEETLHQALSLIEQMEAGKKDMGMDTPIIPTSSIVRTDLWKKAETLKKRVSLRCAGDKIAQLEVQLVWAGHEEKEFDWRHAKPYLQAAERLAREADEQMAACPPDPEHIAARIEPAPPNLELSSAQVEAATKGELSAVKIDPLQVNIKPADGKMEQAAVAKLNPAERAAATVPAPANTVKSSEPLAAAAASEMAPAGALLPFPVVAALPAACPEVVAGGAKMLSPLPDRVHFALDRAEIGAASAALLDKIATAMKSEPTLRVMLQGHADQRGQFTYNIRLSQRRANSVRAYLVNSGVAGDRISVIALGRAKPLIPDGTIDGYARNRRVEFVFTSCESPLLLNQREDLQPEQR